VGVTIVAAVADNGVIGREGGLPWRIPDDLQRFKRLTMGHTLVMGRRTFESIGRALPGRRTIVVTRSVSWSTEADVTIVHGLHEALEAAGDDDVFIVGGAEIYRLALPLADRMALTEVHQSPEGDTWFPSPEWSDWREVRRHHCGGHSFVDYERIAREP
jgi:dihydrofolate reductase